MLTKAQAIEKTRNYLKKNDIAQQFIGHGITVDYPSNDRVCLRLNIDTGDIYTISYNSGDKLGATINLIMVDVINTTSYPFNTWGWQDMYAWVDMDIQNYDWEEAINRHYDYYPESQNDDT